jgi:hypothetical protein
MGIVNSPIKTGLEVKDFHHEPIQKHVKVFLPAELVELFVQEIKKTLKMPEANDKDIGIFGLSRECDKWGTHGSKGTEVNFEIYDADENDINCMIVAFFLRNNVSCEYSLFFSITDSTARI